MTQPGQVQGRGQGEALVVWAVWAVLCAAIVATYWRLPAEKLYHTSVEGLPGGLGRALVETNYPISLAAIPIVLVALAVLPSRAWWIGVPAIACCAVTPFVVDQSDLDARPGNAIPAVGVAAALGLTIWASRSAGSSFAARLPGDPIRIGATIVLLVISLPWIAADLGFYFPDGISSHVITEGKETLAAVHLGDHHGLSGALLAVSALLLSRARVPAHRLGVALDAIVALMLSYGVVNAAEDGWHEQVVKRGWVEWRLHSAILPSASPEWLGILALAVLFFAAFRLERRNVTA